MKKILFLFLMMFTTSVFSEGTVFTSNASISDVPASVFITNTSCVPLTVDDPANFDSCMKGFTGARWYDPIRFDYIVIGAMTCANGPYANQRYCSFPQLRASTGVVHSTGSAIRISYSVKTCPVGSSYNATTKSCSEPCDAKAGQTFNRSFAEKYPPPTAASGLTESFPGYAYTISQGGCEATNTKVTSCAAYMAPDVGGWGSGCNFEYKYTGRQSNVPDAPTTTTSNGVPVASNNPPPSTVTNPPKLEVDGSTTTTTTFVDRDPNSVTFEQVPGGILITYTENGQIVQQTKVNTKESPEGTIVTTTEVGTLVTPSITTVVYPTDVNSTSNSNVVIIPSLVSTLPTTVTIETTGLNGNTTTTTTTSGSGGGSGSGGSGGGKSDGSCTGIDCSDEVTLGSPGVPVSWWESKYPEGVSGTFQSFQAAHINNGPLGQWLKSWSMPSAGSVPTWTVSTAGLPINLGALTLTIDPSIWSIIRAIVLFSAVILAFRLITGIK